MAGPLSGDVDIPKVGKFPKIVVVLGVGGVLGLIVWERRKASAAASAPASGAAGSDPYPSDGTTGNPSDPNSIDPSSGITYGDEQAGYGGTAAYGGAGASLQSAGDAYPWDGTTGDSSDPYSLDPTTGQTYGNEGSTGTSGSTGGPPFSSNAQWSQYVLNYFSTNGYGDIPGRTDAIGNYLTGAAVTQAQVQYIHDATAIAGQAPVAGASGYPPSIRTSGSQGGTVTVPKVTGQPQEAAFAILSAAGLHPKGSPTVKGETLTVDKQSPPSGSHVQRGSTVTLTSTAKKGSTATAKVKVPDVVGQEQSRAFAKISAAGLKPAGPAAVKGKVHTVTAESPKAGTDVAHGSTVTLTSKTS